MAEQAMVFDSGMPRTMRSVPLPVILIAIPVGFALLGLLLRLCAYLVAGWHPHLGGYPDGLCRWDCQWYVILARSGYDPFPIPQTIDAGNWAFFPLFPMIIGGLYALSRIDIMTIATGVSIAFSIAAALVAWPLLERNIRAYTLYCAFLLCGPFSIYFTSFLTEVLFVLMTNCVMLALRRSNYIAAGGFAALLSATRIVGVFMVFAIVAQYLLDYRKRGAQWRALPQHLWQKPEIVLAVVLTPLGLFGYMAYLHFYMGDALAFSHVQRAWGRVPGNPFNYLWIALTDWPDAGVWPSTNQWLGLSVIVGFAATILLVIKRQFAMALFCLICLIVPLSLGLASMLRFVAALSPVVLVLITALARSRLLYVASLLGFIVADYFFTTGWLQGWLPLV